MDNKDKQVLTKIHKHITAIISYCGCCTDFEDFQKDVYQNYKKSYILVKQADLIYD